MDAFVTILSNIDMEMEFYHMNNGPKGFHFLINGAVCVFVYFVEITRSEQTMTK